MEKFGRIYEIKYAVTIHPGHPTHGHSCQRNENIWSIKPCTQMFIAVLLIIPKIGNNVNVPQ